MRALVVVTVVVMAIVASACSSDRKATKTASAPTVTIPTSTTSTTAAPTTSTSTGESAATTAPNAPVGTNAPPATTGPARAVDPTSVLTATGLGELKLDMTVDEARRATGKQLRYKPPQPEGGPLCGTLDVVMDGVEVILDGQVESTARIEEIDVSSTLIRSDHGVRVGSTAADVLRAYPNATRVNSHESEALAVYTAGGALVFRFAVGGGQEVAPTARVTDMSSTRRDVVTTEELCA